MESESGDDDHHRDENTDGNQNYDENGDTNSEIDRIAKANEEFNRAKANRDATEFGFENIALAATSKKVIRKKRRQSNSVGRKATKKSKISTGQKPGQHHKNTNPSTSTDIAETVASNSNADGNENVLWTARKGSKTKYLERYYRCVKRNGAEMNVVCKLCQQNLEVTIGNNSNLMSHLKYVSYCCCC